MFHDSSGAERAVTIWTIVMLIVLVISILSFTGIIGEGPRASNGCKLPKNFECSDVKITKDSVEFDVIYSARALEKLDILPEEPTCSPSLTNGMNDGDKLHITIKCTSTAEVGKKFKMEFKIVYTEAEKLQDTAEGSVIGKVVAV